MGFSFFGKKGQSEPAKGGETSELNGQVREHPNSEAVLTLENIRLGLPSVTCEEAIEMTGQLLVSGGYVTPEYVGAMHERETVLSTYIGDGIAIPHGVGKAAGYILKSGICILQFPEGVAYPDGEKAYLMVGIAGKGNRHLEILAGLAELLQEREALQTLFTTRDPEQIYQMLTGRL